MNYTIVKQVIGEIDLMHCVDMTDCIDTMNEIYDEMYKEGVGYSLHQQHQHRWGAKLLFEVHCDDGCIYLIFNNELTD